MKILLSILNLLLIAAGVCGVPTWPISTATICPEYCCCKVCSDPGLDSYPYGVIAGLADTPREQGGPVDPKLEGNTGQCDMPTWQRVGNVYYDHDNNETTPNILHTAPPNTIWWKDDLVFGDSSLHIAPFNCDCCRFSGIHTNCQYTRPAATRPDDFVIAGELYETNAVAITFTGGIELSITDFAEIRNTPTCGYDDPVATMSSVNMTSSSNATQHNSTTMLWEVGSLPSKGCYILCYYHSKLTTPTWYEIGRIDILAAPAAPTLYTIDPSDVVIADSLVTFTVSTGSGYNVFTDSMHIRRTGTPCSSSSDIITESTLTGIQKLRPTTGYEWCSPPVTPKVSTQRPIRYIEVEYSDCEEDKRLLAPGIQWSVVLPEAGGYEVCYRKAGVWTSLGSLVIPKVEDVSDALMALYAATGGMNWYHSHGWGMGDPCGWYGVECNENSSVLTISLARNNLQGSIPDNFTRGDFKQTLVLNLEWNDLNGEIPQTIGHWESLSALDLGYNTLQGAVPTSLTKCPIRVLYLPDNVLDGNLPYELRSLVVVRSIYVEGSTQLEPLEVPQPVKYLVTEAPTPRCPTHDFFCTETQATTGVIECGYGGITETVCISIGCCWNPQDVNGKPCFTKKRVTFDEYPVCNEPLCTPKYNATG
eukprot:TRINITY_DN4005_c0_g3_i1.p2 TRINITY_DN4005_c0_g3~~TRINITY_DN4005_c0_g3_i1.p2  ORF type:complete len:647 (+),score=131.26 TRINITY_DN4005_c0_g3_i1:2661-4601(+)